MGALEPEMVGRDPVPETTSTSSTTLEADARSDPESEPERQESSAITLVGFQGLAFVCLIVLSFCV